YRNKLRVEAMISCGAGVSSNPGLDLNSVAALATPMASNGKLAVVELLAPVAVETNGKTVGGEVDRDRPIVEGCV
ncbi:threonine dehydratase catabolic, partial [Corchorus capsularis]